MEALFDNAKLLKNLANAKRFLNRYLRANPDNVNAALPKAIGQYISKTIMEGV